MIRLRQFSVGVAALLALAMLVSGCGKPAERAPESSPAPASPATSAATPTVTLEELKAAGVQIVADEQARVDTGGGLVFTRAQADYLVAEQSRGGGILGRDLDRLAAMPASSPPLSYLIAAWIVEAPTPSAKTAAALMGERDWRYAQSIVFPSAVVTMFVADVASALDRETRPSRSWQRPPLRAIPMRADPCGLATSFLANAIDTIFNKLKLDPKTGADIPLIGWLVVVWDKAVELLRGIVHAVVDALTQPAFAALRTAMGILAVVALIKSYIGAPQLTVELNPPDTGYPGKPYHFAIGDEAPIKGVFVAKADPKQAWPEELTACAKAVGVKMPEVVADGAKVTWTAIDVVPVTNLARSTDGVVENNQALLPFETGREDADAPKRRQVVAPASATAKVERKELDELLKLVRARLHGAIDEMLGKIKIDLVRSGASTVVYAIVNPVLNELQAELNRLGSGVLTVSGTGTVWVAFHEPEQPTPTPTPEPKPSKKPKPKGDFCGKYREAALWWSKQGGLAAAGEFANRLRAIRSLASPAQRGDLDVMIKIFDLVASGANPGVIGNEVEKNDFPGAGKRLGTACNVDPSWFQM